MCSSTIHRQWIFLYSAKKNLPFFETRFKKENVLHRKPDFFTRRGLVHINHSFNESDFKLLVLMLKQHNINIFCRSKILAKVLLLDFFSGAYCFCVIHPQNGLTLPSRNDIMHIFYLKVWKCTLLNYTQ